MRIGFIGAGKVGCTLGKYFRENGIPVSGYYNRTSEHAKEAAEFTDTLYYEDVNDLINESDMIFITVSDNSIPMVYGSLDKKILAGKIIAHSSGALSSSVFTDSGTYGFYGYSIHPIYAVNDRFTAYKNFQNAFITIEGNEDKIDFLLNLFRSLGNKTAKISSENKVRYHSAAVFASNLVCGLFGKAEDILVSCGFSQDDAKDALKGLFLDNASGIADKGPMLQLTGPIERNDTGTVRKHLDVLSEDEKEVYIAASKAVLKLAKRKHSDRDYNEMETLLGSGKE
ncbi:Rossmann-like and DUF2520 domain-containing protein [Eubacterium sp.]|uniref:Rossmann-like and DUF2520 domain-containing protein n=1 Tax=Eubacterium sp. TaxID=142586 RepID=UPI0025876E70|nr:Rossmann-like and DUF2520 domain-containing protein [Eubacterium sp.]MCR5368778.1 DUF2520 domain-containing protein [Eubacterium sp.]